MGIDTSQLSSPEHLTQRAISFPEAPSTFPCGSHWPEVCHMVAPSYKGSWEEASI